MNPKPQKTIGVYNRVYIWGGKVRLFNKFFFTCIPTSMSSSPGSNATTLRVKKNPRPQPKTVV